LNVIVGSSSDFLFGDPVVGRHGVLINFSATLPARHAAALLLSSQPSSTPSRVRDMS